MTSVIPSRLHLPAIDVEVHNVPIDYTTETVEMRVVRASCEIGDQRLAVTRDVGRCDLLQFSHDDRTTVAINGCVAELVRELLDSWRSEL